MSTSALILMITVQGVVTVITAYFLIRVLKSNDDIKSGNDGN